MFRWAHPEHLYALLLIPAIVLLFAYRIRTRRIQLQRLGENELVRRLMPDTSKRKPILRFIVFTTAFACMVMAWANPQIGTRLEEVKREGVDVIIALDVSNSMRAEDLRPNRLERAKQIISRLIDRLENDRIGLIVFAGQAYVQLPITTDYAAAKLFLSNISTNMIPTQGTAIGAAINLALKSYTGNDNKHKALVIITDGENHEDDAVEAARDAASQGVIIHTIGMGSPEGTPIPAGNGNQDFLRDNDGNTVVTKLDEITLQKVAAEGRGRYIHSTSGDDGLDVLLTQIGKMEKKTYGTKQFTDYEDRFQYLLVIGLILLIGESLIGNRKSPWWAKINLEDKA
jgi:Ca-activated chloride channel family protein